MVLQRNMLGVLKFVTLHFNVMYELVVICVIILNYSFASFMWK
jgi:hypothetical protein